MSDDRVQVRRALRALFSPLGCPDPYPLYAVLRERAPVARLPDGTVVVTRHADCDRVLRDPLFRVEDDEWIARTWPEGPEHLAVHSLMGEMVNQNSPHHERLRRLVSRAFTPRRVEELRPAVQRLTDALLDDLAEHASTGPVDLMERLALPLPITVIGELLGIPEEDRAWFGPRVRDITSAIEHNLLGPDLERADAATAELWDRLGALVAERQADPREDMVSTLIAVRDADGDRLTHRELLANLVLLYSAGYETTSNLIGNGTATLLDHPGLLARLRGEPDNVAAWVDEMLRFTPPIQIASRWTGEDTELHGVHIEKGTQVVALLAGANRDPERYESPDTFLPGRPVSGSLSFGAGAHYCLGAALARMEAQVVFPRLLARFPHIAHAGPALARTRVTSLRGYDRLPLDLR
ncbi:MULTISPECIES: cytochrome P450 [Streptomyces]|uniref:Cytochrome P450 n=1 Tax=Streptomyces virginiae TaxID=1961 RepID=A0ABQ3NDD2_STRVG|nr:MULTISPECIES: cytochrome P450 [Streptomyces]KOU85313.1 cytochrome P450 [Streptomyces sp. XY593]KOU96107.1 cytochrome P450 [Streptomyces sp. XY533]KOV08285.1 cytochrome P450 [Streptomyces sp. XY511]MBP2346099.1 cytochrome P450 [Streptomyces virginiae]QNE25639.1 cytochrome P450 [Streptomyces sp. INR7]